MNKKREALYEYDFQEFTRNLRTEAGKLKTEIFRATVMKRDLDQKVVNAFNGYVNDFLRYWEEYAEEYQKKMKECKAAPGRGTIEYNEIKDWVYGNYDYASILPFADGLVQGITSGKFKDPEDVEDFFDHTVKKAFNDIGDSVANVIERATSFEYHPASQTDVKMFDTIASYNKLFDSRARTELYKAITKTIEYFTTDIGAKQFPNQKDVKMFVSMINNVVEYIVFSLTIYAARTFVIQVYSREFVFSSAKGANVVSATEAVTESADDKSAEEKKKDQKPKVPSVKDTVVPDHKFTPIQVFHDTDENVFKDYERDREAVKVLTDFISQTGCDGIDLMNGVTNLEHPWVVSDKLKDNCFIQKLQENPLYTFITKGHYFGGMSDKDIAETHQVLKSLIYNKSQGMEGTSSPKQGFLHVIRGTKVDDTLKGYQKLASDFVSASIMILSSTGRALKSMIEWKKMEKDRPSFRTTSDSLASECLRMLDEFYREIAGAIYQRGVDIELHINDLHSSDIKNIIGSFNIKVGSDLSSNNVMMSAVPDTTRLPTEMMDGYDIPSFEAMQLYDEWARSLPGMESVWYYNEAVDISALINALIAKIRGWFKRVSSFVNDKKFEAAAKWVTDHEKDLLSMDYSGGKMEVLPYKVTVTVPDVVTGLVKNLGDFTLDSVKSQTDLDEFIKKLYGNETVYSWFHNQGSDKNNGARMYRNYILFQDLNEVNDQDPKMVPLDGANIQKNMKYWIETVKDYKNFLAGVKKISDDLERNVNNVKSKLASIQSQSTSQSQTTPPSVQSSSDSSEKDQSNADKAAEDANKVQNQNSKTEADNNKALYDRLMAEITLAMERLWGSCTGMFIAYISNEYKYLQEAYSIGRKKQ